MKNIFLLLLLSFCACSNVEDEMTTPPILVSDESLPTFQTYLALGDSYTIGQSVSEMGRFPIQLTEKLNDDGFDFSNPKIIAQTGWTTSNLQTGITSESIEGQIFDIVSLLIGVNNQYQGRDIEEYKTEYAELLNQAIAFANNDENKVFVVSIPDYAFTPFGQSSGNAETISIEIDEFNAACKEITEAAGVAFFNITPISRQGLDESELVASDNLHPSAEQYSQWVDFFYEDVKSLIED